MRNQKQMKMMTKKSKITDKNNQITKALETINEENIKQITKSRKFVGFNNSDNVIISLQMSKIIQKEFSLLSLNYVNGKYQFNNNPNHNLEGKSTTSGNNVNTLTFKPVTNQNSNILSQNYRKKIQNELENEMSSIKSHHHDQIRSNSSAGKRDYDENFNINYINMLLIKRKKKDKLMAQKREEIESKELSNCTFKPKVNVEYSFSNTIHENSTQKTDVFDNLYKHGKNLKVNRKDRTKEEIEIEKNGKECVFNPQINSNPIDFSKSPPGNYNSPEYQKYFERLKQGRVERKTKDIVHSREPLSAIKEFEHNVNNPEKKERKNKNNNINTNDNAPSNNDNEVPQNKVSSPIIQSKNPILNNLKDTKIESKPLEIKEEKKELIPLLVIDVNLKPGEKKKIYVFDGDTAEGLAEKFTKDNNLDKETSNKLKILIQSHMSKLLLGIKEVNESLNSERSSSNN